MHLLDEIIQEPRKMLKFLKNEITIGLICNIPFLILLIFHFSQNFGECYTCDPYLTI